MILVTSYRHRIQSRRHNEPNEKTQYCQSISSIADTGSIIAAKSGKTTIGWCKNGMGPYMSWWSPTLFRIPPLPGCRESTAPCTFMKDSQRGGADERGSATAAEISVESRMGAVPAQTATPFPIHVRRAAIGSCTFVCVGQLVFAIDLVVKQVEAGLGGMGAFTAADRVWRGDACYP